MSNLQRPSSLSPTTDGTDYISKLKELVESENKERSKDERRLFTLPEAYQENGDWVAICEYSSIRTRRTYHEKVRMSQCKKKDAQREACRLVWLKYNRDVSGLSVSSAPTRSPSSTAVGVATPSTSARRILNVVANPTSNSSSPMRSSSVADVLTPPNSRSLASRAVTAAAVSTAAQIFSTANSPPNVDDSGKTARKVQHSIFYFPGKKLGAGGFGKVYEGYFENTSRRAAVKQIHTTDEENKSVKNEVDMMLKLDQHPNIVRYFATEYDLENATTYIAMELASDSLDGIIKGRKYESFDQLRLYMHHTSSGLAYLHYKKTIHRDISPNNILIFLPGKLPKIGDFGITRSVESMTQGGVTMNLAGNQKWMSPESDTLTEQGQYRYTNQGDIFSLGLVIFYAMSPKHCHAFGENINTPITTIALNIRSPAQSPQWNHLKDSEYNYPLQSLCSAMLSKDPIKRPRIEAVLEHPFFWNGERFLKFITDCSNDLKNVKKEKKLRIHIDAAYESFSCKELKVHVNWKVRLHHQIRDQLLDSPDHTRTKTYDGTSLVFLVEFIRDKDQHTGEWSQKNPGKDSPLASILGVRSANYGAYFMNCFPELASFLYTYLQKRQDQLPKVKEDFYRSVTGVVFDEL